MKPAGRPNSARPTAGVDRVKVRQNVDERLADPAAILRCLRVSGRKGVAADVTDDALHQVKRRAQRAVGVTEVKGPRHRHRRIGERGHHAILAAHVVRGRQDVAERRATQDHLAGVAGDAIGQIGLPARDQRDVTVEPARVVEDVGQHRPDDLRVGARRDPLQPLRGRIVESELLGGGHTATRS